jgi:sodium-dependent dicarboxylate transporter 2/3/5
MGLRLPSRSVVQRGALVAGPAAGGLTFVLLSTAELGPVGQASAALAVWMAIWWLSEAIPIAATALLPVAVLPLAGRGVAEAASPYAHRFIFLFFGGFVVALSMERWGLHRRIALGTLQLVGTRPRRIVGGFMGITALLSMWISNTATAVMMLPIARSVVDLAVERAATESGHDPSHGHHFSLCLLLGVAYGASIGGVGTIVGTPPNLFVVSYIRESLGHEVSFVRWLGVGLPVVIVMLPLTWWMLTRWIYPVGGRELAGGRQLLREQLVELGAMTRGEVVTLVVFSLMALGWMTRPLLTDLAVGGVRPLAGLGDTSIALLAALALFVIPAGKGEPTMNWETARRIPWGILLLFGGGLSLAAGLDDTGVTELVGQSVQALEGVPDWLMLLAVAALVVFLTEITSNTATTTALVPILAGVAAGVGMDPLSLVVPAALAASCAFMMPVATPPNAVVFGSGRVTIPEMARAGVRLNLLSIALVAVIGHLIARPLLGGP